MQKVCAITGATGYVGARIAQLLATVFDVVPVGSRVGAEGIRWSMNQGDVRDSLHARGVKALVHVAWDMKETVPSRNWQTNVEGSRALIAQALQAGVEKIVFISSISSFEGARSAYGKSKLAVEKAVLAAGGTVIRPGLVWGERPGGMFGALRTQVSHGGMVPVIGDGRHPQFLVHEDDLAATVLSALDDAGPERLITAANPQSWLLRDLIVGIAEREGKKIRLLSVPWRLIYAGLATAETLGIRLGFRSDSVLSLVYQNRQPHFSSSLPFRPFQLSDLAGHAPDAGTIGG